MPPCVMNSSSSAEMMALSKDRRNVFVGDDLPALGRELTDYRAVAAEHASDRAGRVVVERGNCRQVVGEREQHAAGRAKTPRP